MLWVISQVRHFTGILVDVEQQPMIDLRVDVQLPFTVTDGALVILVRQKDRVMNFFFLPTDQGQDADGIDPGRGFNLGKITQGGIEVMDVGLGTGFTFSNAGATDNEWARHAVLIDTLFAQ